MKAPLRHHNSIVDIRETVVLKYAEQPEVLAQKYSAVHSISVDRDFTAPRVLDVKPGYIVLERLHDIVPLRSLYTGSDVGLLACAMERAGEVLACLHLELPAGEALPWAPPKGFVGCLQDYSGIVLDLSSLRSAVLHCDYSFANVFIRGGDPNRIAVIDPCANLGSTFSDWTYGPVLLDIGKMLGCLEGQVAPAINGDRPKRPQVNMLQRTFIDSYRRIGLDFSIEDAFSFAYATVVAQFKRRFGRLGRYRASILYNRLRDNYPLNRKLKDL